MCVINVRFYLNTLKAPRQWWSSFHFAFINIAKLQNLCPPPLKRPMRAALISAVLLNCEKLCKIESSERWGKKCKQHTNKKQGGILPLALRDNLMIQQTFGPHNRLETSHTRLNVQHCDYSNNPSKKENQILVAAWNFLSCQRPMETLMVLISVYKGTALFLLQLNKP